MTWRLYYTDRTRFTSDDGGWDEAPAWGVAAVAVPNDTVGVQIDTGDFYVWWSDSPEPWAADMWGLTDFLVRHDRMTADQPMCDLSAADLIVAGVKFGRSLDNRRWRDVWNWIVDDTRDWGHGKAGQFRWERVPVDAS